MSHVGAVRVPVLVHQPLPLAGVGVSGADVLRLKMLQLTVDVVSVRHVGDEEEMPSESGGGEARLMMRQFNDETLFMMRDY